MQRPLITVTGAECCRAVDDDGQNLIHKLWHFWAAVMVSAVASADDVAFSLSAHLNLSPIELLSNFKSSSILH